jgi:hypothetical protein
LSGFKKVEPPYLESKDDQRYLKIVSASPVLLAHLISFSPAVHKRKTSARLGLSLSHLPIFLVSFAIGVYSVCMSKAIPARFSEVAVAISEAATVKRPMYSLATWPRLVGSQANARNHAG